MLLTKNKPLHLIAGAIATFNLLTLKLLIKNPRRVQTYPGRVFREYMSLVGHDQWQCKDIFDILPIKEGTRIVLEHLPGRGVGNPVNELAYLALVTRAVAPKRVFEIGTFRGRTALNFAINSPEECVVYTLDIPPQAPSTEIRDLYQSDIEIVQHAAPGADYRNKEGSHKIVQLFGDSQTFDFSPYYGQIDLVFVDGAHHYEAVKRDTENALKIIRPGGYILWHDFANFGDYNDVTLAVLDTLPIEFIIEIDNTQLAIYHHLPKEP